jgi:hypothetical protein
MLRLQSKLLLSLITILLAIPVHSQNDDVYEDYGIDYGVDCGLQEIICDFHNHEVCADQCHHGHLPKKSMEELFGPKVSKCCAGHGYTYYEQCKVSSMIIIVYGSI